MSKADWVDCGQGVQLERAVRCRMSDGVELISDHYYPARPVPQPTLLMRQPYGRDIASTVVYAHPVWFARHGYNVVIQDVRGRGDSGGEFYPFRYEARDGAETIAWLRTREESNGRIGMYGFSYQGADAIAGRRRTTRGTGLHFSWHDRLRSLPRVVLSPRSDTPFRSSELGIADAESRRAPEEATGRQRSSRKGLAEPRRANQCAPVP